MTPSTVRFTGATASGPDRPGGAGLLGGRTVARIGYGAMQLERLRTDRPAAVALVRQALALGVDHVDTAQFYGDGFVNDVLREALERQDNVVIATKVGADPDPGGPVPMRLAQRPEQLRASVEDNLTTLRLDRIPLVNLRRMDSGSRITAEGDQVVDIEDQLAALTAMRDQGKIGSIGLSSVTLDGLRRALPAGITCVQNAFSLLSRQDADLLELCTTEGIAWVPYFPLGSAFPGLPKVTEEPAVRAAADAAGHTPSQIGLAWLLQHAPNILLIPGTADSGHLEENVAAGRIELNATVIAALDAIPSRPVPTPGRR